MKREHEAGEAVIPFQSVFARVSAATGVSMRTLSRISKEMQNIERGESSQFSSLQDKVKREHKKEH